jgi:hypothetical protein
MSAYCPHCGETVGYFTQSHCKALAEQIRELKAENEELDHRMNTIACKQSLRIRELEAALQASRG